MSKDNFIVICEYLIRNGYTDEYGSASLRGWATDSGYTEDEGGFWYDENGLLVVIYDQIVGALESLGLFDDEEDNADPNVVGQINKFLAETTEG